MTLGLMITVFSLVGTVANIYKKQWCFIIWLGTNTAWLIWDIINAAHGRMVSDGIYILLAAWGLWEWKRKSKMKYVLCSKCSAESE